MPFVFEKLPGLDRDKLVGAIEPVLLAHGFDGVELIWRTDNRGWLLYITIERPDTKDPGAGVTLDDCSELSRDLSVALDVAEVMRNAYRLEVGSPGVERQLYTPQEYARFAGKFARVKLNELLNGEWAWRGTLMGLDELGRVLLDTGGTDQDHGVFAIEWARVQTGQLMLDPDYKKPGKPSGKQGSGKRKRK